MKEVVDDLNILLKEKGEDIKLYPANLIRDNYDNVKEFVNGKLGSINGTKYILLDIEESSDLKEYIETGYLIH